MTLSASERIRQRPLGLICIFLSGSLSDTRQPRALHELAFDPRSFDLGSGDLSPRAPWGSVGVGHDLCVTPSSVSTTRGAELLTLALMARVSRSVSSLTGMFEWNVGP